LLARALGGSRRHASIRYSPHDGIQTALNDLEAGNIGLVINLFPVISWSTKSLLCHVIGLWLRGAFLVFGHLGRFAVRRFHHSQE
jgi:hypothetical protein